MLSAFQDEWSSTVTECYQLRKLLEQTRQELSHTLYQHDAACRVISRLVKERDEARQQLADASAAGKLYTGTAPVALHSPWCAKATRRARSGCTLASSITCLL